MPHNCHTFSDRQLWQLSYKGAFTLVDSSCTAVGQLAESKDENVYIVACHFDSIQQKLRIKQNKRRPTSVELKCSLIVMSRHGVIRLRSTSLNAYSTSVESECSWIGHVETRFQILVEWLKSFDRLLYARLK
jgi:hypothetical protein